MPPKLTALGALKNRPTKMPTAPQDIWDVDQLLADTKDFAGSLPSDPDATGRARADIEASQLRQQQNPLKRAWQSDVGVVGALADSAATPIRVASGFTGMGAGIGEGIAQGLEAIAHLDGKPLAQGGSTLGDVTRSIGKVATSTAFGKIASMNPLTGMLKDAPASAATSLAAKLAGKVTRAGVGALAGSVEGAVPNVAQGAFTRAFDAGDIDAAFDRDGLMLDAGLGVGMGAPIGAMLALGKRAGSAVTGAGLRARPTPAEGPVSSWPKQPDAAPWQPETDQAFADQGSAWFNETPGTRPGSVRGSAPRQRTATPEAPTGPKLLEQNNPPAHPFAMPESRLPPQAPPEVLGTQVAPGQGPVITDILDPSNPYQGPAGDPTAQPPGVPAPRMAPPAGPSLEQMLAELDANPPAPLPVPSPPPTGPELPRGRFAADSPPAQTAEPFVPPERDARISNPARDEFFAAMEDVNNLPDPVAPTAAEGPMVMQPFEAPVPPALAKGMSNPLFGTPERVRFDGKNIEVFYQGKPQPIRMSPEQFADFSPEMSASAPRAAQPIAPPSAMDDPLMAELLNQVRAERATPPPDVPVVRADSETTRFASPQEDMQPAPGIIAEPGTTFAPDPTPPLAVASDEAAPFGDEELEALLRQADDQDAAAAPAPVEDPVVELLDPEAATTQNNASGESGASTEAMNRARSLKAAGQTRVMLDRAGRETPVLGVDGVDVHPQKGQTLAIRNADGSYTIQEDNGGKVPTAKPTAKAEVEPPVLNGAEPSELDRIVLEDVPTPPVRKEELFDTEPLPVAAAPETPAPAAPAVAASIPEAEGIVLGDGDTPGTINQAGKFAKLGDDWRSQEPGKNKNLVIRKADGTYQVVKANGGKTPKTWSKELAEVRESQVAAKQAKEQERLAGIAAKKAERETAATARAEARAAAGQPPEAVVADAPEPVAATPEEPAVGPTTPPRVERTKFGENDAVDVTFERAPHESIRAALTEYGFRYLPWKQKWSFKIPAGSKLTPEDVDGAAQAILRGESTESAQRGIVADAGSQRATAATAERGQWVPEANKSEMLDRDLDPDAAVRDTRRGILRNLGWTQTKNDAGRRVWNAPKASGMRGDMELRPSSDPEVPPANPPQAEAPSRPSADAPDAATTSNPPMSGSTDSKPSTTSTPETPNSPGGATPNAGIEPSATPKTSATDYERIAPEDIKVSPKEYQFKGESDSRGRSTKLKGVEEWDADQALLSPVLLHRRLDGSVYVVDGHQRVGLAQDLKAAGKDVPDLNARVLNESEGVTVERARRQGALANMMHNTADPRDIARVLREGELTPSEQRRIGRIEKDAGEKFKQGRDIAKLSDKAFDYYIDSDLDPRFVRMVSAYRPELQEGLIQQLDRHKPRTNTEAEALLAQAAELRSGGVQTDMFGNTTVDDTFKELVAFKERVISSFRTNRRLFGKAGSAADTLESVGDTKIDRDAAGKVASAAGRAEELWSKFSNAQGSYTRTAIQEAFDDYKAGRISFGKASDRIAEALDADYTGRPPSGPGGGAGDVAGGVGRPDSGDEDLFQSGGLFGDTPSGGVNDPKAVALGRSEGALEDSADDVLERATKIVQRLFEDESGSLKLEGLGAGMEGLENLYKKNPAAVWSAVRTAGGAFYGAATSEEDEASFLDNMVLGAAAGYGAGKLPGLARALKGKAPTFAKALKETMETGRLLSRGEYNAVTQVRRAPSLDKDISGLAMKFWSPDKVVPDLWKHIEPIMEDIRNIDNGADTVFEARVARRAKLEEALTALDVDSRKSANKGHYRRMKYIDALHDELSNKPTWMERQVSEATSGKVSVKTIRQANAIATNAIYHNLLGWALDSGLANMTQALMNIPQIGVKSTVKGIVKAYTTAGRQELKFLNVARPMGHDEEKLFHPWVEKYLDLSQKPMSWSDSGNRRATWAGALDYAAKRGMSKEKAEDFARTLIGQTQGVAGELGSNPFHRNLGPLKVFTKYPTLWASMLEDVATHPDAKVKMRFLGMATGIVGASAISGVEWMNFFWPRMGGLPGPSIALDVIDHAVGAPDHDFEEHMEIGGTEDRVFPRYINKGAAILNRSGEARPIVGRKGQQLREVSEDEDLLSLFGIETTNRAETRKQESEMYEFAQESRRESGIDSRQARRKAGLAIAQDDNEAAGEAMRALSRRQQSDFLRDRKRSPLERARRQVPLSRRAEFDERFQQEER